MSSPNTIGKLPHTEEDLDMLARTIFGEARGETFSGKLAVGWVVRNRVESGREQRFGSGIIGVCRKPWQFSAWNPGDPNERKCQEVTVADVSFVDCLAAARAALEGNLPDPTRGADHYHVAGIEPYWAENRDPVAVIGRHVFYKLRD